MILETCPPQLEQAQDATEKRKQLEIEKDITPDLVEKYKVVTPSQLPLVPSLHPRRLPLQVQAEKEQRLAETLMEMRRSFYCQLCDKQYYKYSEYDNHLNSYDHHHRQVKLLA